MGRELAERYRSAREVYARTDRALGRAISELCFAGPESDLTLTANLQPALVATSSAIAAALSERYPALPAPTCAAGHSLGEYSALLAAGAFELETAVSIVRERGQAMQAAVGPGEGAMLALLGGSLEDVVSLCKAARGDSVLEPANLNCPGQVVVAGHASAVERARGLARDFGLKGIPLKVSAPFHCPLMRPATEAMQAVLDKVTVNDLAFPVFANVTAASNADATQVVDLLVRQIEGAVRFQETIENMVRDGVTKALELGPGGVLAGLVKKTTAQIEVLPVFDAATIESVGAFLALD
jgi:[acyl-carrier-protein] S-malonyltransferase